MPGGVGNQLFALFASRFFSEKSNHTIRLNFSTVDRHHAPIGHDLRSLLLQESEVGPSYSSLFSNLMRVYYPNNLFSRGVFGSFLKQNQEIFDLNFDRVNDVERFLIASPKMRTLPLRISGYFGDFGFYDRLSFVNKMVQLKNPSNRYFHELDKIKSSRTLGVHLRLGDFLSNPDSIGVLSDTYYASSLNRLSNDYDRILLFTNDYTLGLKRIEHWRVNKGIEILDFHYENDPLEDLFLMSACSKLILSNSTFSFWGAKLSNSDIVIYPTPFRKDNLTEIGSIPKTWVSNPSSWA